MKCCPKCARELPRTPEFFCVDNRNKDGLGALCRTCNQERTRDHMRKYREQHPESNALYYAENRDREIARLAKWSQDNPERNAKRIAQWASENPDRRAVSEQRRRAKKRQTIEDFTPQDWQFAVDHFSGRCAACGRSPGFFHTLSIDHWIPLASPDCPGHIPANIVPLCNGLGGCNQGKNRTAPEEWLTKKFGKKRAKAILAKVHEFFSKVRQI